MTSQILTFRSSVQASCCAVSRHQHKCFFQDWFLVIMIMFKERYAKRTFFRRFVVVSWSFRTSHLTTLSSVSFLRANLLLVLLLLRTGVVSRQSSRRLSHPDIRT